MDLVDPEAEGKLRIGVSGGGTWIGQPETDSDVALAIGRPEKAETGSVYSVVFSAVNCDVADVALAFDKTNNS